MEKKPLPIGVDDFEKLINYPYYYVDKTLTCALKPRVL